MASTLYTKRQMLSLLYGWGYTLGTLPTKTRTEMTVSIGREDLTQTRAVVTFGPVNGAGQRLYSLTFIS
jgi:hypothetical protein